MILLIAFFVQLNAQALANAEEIVHRTLERADQANTAYFARRAMLRFQCQSAGQPVESCFGLAYSEERATDVANKHRQVRSAGAVAAHEIRACRERERCDSVGSSLSALEVASAELLRSLP